MPQSQSLPRAFTFLASANLAAQSAEQLALAAAPIVAVLALHAGPGEIGMLGFAQTLPYLLLSIPIGLLADRVSRRGLMLVAEGVRAATLVALLVATALGGLSIPLLIVLGFLGAIGTVGFTVAAPALVPSLVPREQFAQANGRIELARSIAYAGGPALAGALVSWAGGAAAFTLAAMLSASAVALLMRLREPERARAPARHPWHDLREGASFVWHHELLRSVLLAATAWNTSWFVLQAAYVPYAVRALGLDAKAVGLTLAGYGVGMVVGALLAPRIVRAMPFGRAVQLGPVVSVLAGFTMVATLFWPSAWLAGASFFLFGVGPIVWTITTTTLRQSVTPGTMLGRASSIFLTVNAGSRPIGAALGGLIGAHFGEAACLWVMAFGFTAQAAFIVLSPMKRLVELPSQAAEPAPRGSA